MPIESILVLLKNYCREIKVRKETSEKNARAASFESLGQEK